MFPPYESLLAYWSGPELATNALIVLNLAGALALGLLVGYERSYHGRAAGMRTYGLVCMASCALTVISGYPESWYGSHNSVYMAAVDPTRVIQGIVTGVGFLGAGMIMREGFTISGLTTAASIWASSVTGVLVGVGFYMSAIFLALMCAGVMVYLSRVESFLPSRHAVAITMRFKPGFVPREDGLREIARDRGYQIAGGSLSISSEHGRQEWRFVALERSQRSGARISELAAELNAFEGIDSFQLSHARN
ncbi:MgtC/SapB family protein [Pseudoduganella sp. GCM10020061]|uniref:MgtC/SapB family protein n=1 Tax=Pseudoduganella sp. GCM10020061 TaxID=3317345 RepID=UPI00362A4E55